MTRSEPQRILCASDSSWQRPLRGNDRVERVDRCIQSFPRNASNLQPNDGVRNMNQAKENRHQGRNNKRDEPSRRLNRVHNSTFNSSLAKKVSQKGPNRKPGTWDQTQVQTPLLLHI